MNLQPTLELGHTEIHLAEGSESSGCFCCWKSKPAKPKEYVFNDDNHLVPVYKRVDALKRAVSNAKLNEIILSSFEPCPIDNEEAYKSLKERLSEDPDDCSIPITQDRLKAISDEIFKLRKEIESYHGKKKHLNSKSSE